MSIVILIVLIGGIIFFLYQEYKISQLDTQIGVLFRRQSNTIPSIYEISKGILNKHNEIFAGLIYLRKEEFHIQSLQQHFHHVGILEQKISHEIQFIFTVCEKHKELSKQKKFLYIKDIMTQQTIMLQGVLKKRNTLIKQFNTYIDYKNISLIGFLLPFRKKDFI